MIGCKILRASRTCSSSKLHEGVCVCETSLAVADSHVKSAILTSTRIFRSVLIPAYKSLNLESNAG